MFVGLLAFPGFLFAHKLEQGNLVVYSDEDLSGSIEPILREIDRRLATSEINDPALTHRIFFGHDAQIFGALQRARAEIVYRTIGMKPAASYNASWPPHMSHIVTFDVPDAAHDALRRSAWPGHFNMTHILTHEVTHTLVTAKLGLAQIPRACRCGKRRVIRSTSQCPQAVRSPATRCARAWRESSTRTLRG